MAIEKNGEREREREKEAKKMVPIVLKVLNGSLCVAMVCVSHLCYSVKENRT